MYLIDSFQSNLDCFLHDDIADVNSANYKNGRFALASKLSFGLLHNHVKPKFCHIFVPLTAPFSWKRGGRVKGEEEEGIILSSPSLGLVKYHEFPVSGSS
ncbi:hypothetical protein Patl1_21243 [Pistacia atlantica]|uniref:Uncharacterized protein n=1 Tax=Pistacia atlantica TaxID=434234 RepID=A0ACC1BJ84_9ROSI|nr:hypothetical protein Patl1_21243 [Pistacia atlantica]